MSARARPLLPECALVNKIYCEDARVSWSWLCTEKWKKKGKGKGKENGMGDVSVDGGT